MSKKKIVIAALAILSVLFLTPAVYAKIEKIYFYSDFGDWWIVDSAVIFDEEGRPWIAQVTIGGVMYEPGVLGPPIPFGDFTSVDTIYYNYDHEGNMKYWTHNLVVTISNGGDTLTIHATCKLVYDVPTDFQKLGTYKIVDGTGLWSAIAGRGEYKFPFQFYGTIR